MKLERIYTPGLAQVAYLVGDERSGVAAVIDSRRDVKVYTELAQAAGLRITHIFETHIHADFVSGAGELSATTGAQICAGRLGQSEFPHQPLDDGDMVEVGRLQFQALWTPGHTPEHMSYLLTDPSVGDRAQLLFSGDMLFVGEVGRPDLLGADATTRQVEQLYDSIYGRLMHLPDELIVYPGHGAGSSCGKSIGDSPSTTLGQEKLFNYAFQLPDRDAFRRAIMDGLPPAPTYYPVLKKINKAGAARIATMSPGRPLSACDVRDLRQQGALVIDGRAYTAFGGAHVPCSVFAGLGDSFVVWAGWFAPYERDVVLVLERDDEFEDARTQLRRIGVDRVAGYLQGGFSTWAGAGFEIASLPQISVHELKERLEHNTIQLLDVRSSEEWKTGHIAGACNHFAGEIVRSAGNGKRFRGIGDGPMAVICASGFRSSVAASVLQRGGHGNVVNVVGGNDAWRAAGYPFTKD